MRLLSAFYAANGKTGTRPPSPMKLAGLREPQRLEGRADALRVAQEKTDAKTEAELRGVAELTDILDDDDWRSMEVLEDD